MRTVYFNEYNVRMGSIRYLPLVSGLLRSYAETFPLIRQQYRFMLFIYAMDRPAVILGQYTEAPDVACFSSVTWNEQLNYHIAERVKLRWPECLVGIPGAAVRDLVDPDITHFNASERTFKREMDEYPSPYLEGLYDELMEAGRAKGHEFQAIIEANRGAPFRARSATGAGADLAGSSGIWVWSAFRQKSTGWAETASNTSSMPIRISGCIRAIRKSLG